MLQTQAPVVTLLTDFGDRDYYVSAVKGVLLSLVPAVRLADICHAVDPGDLHHAAFLLGAVWREFPPGTVHLAVVDPGVGSSRSLLAARVDQRFVVAPDNGLASLVFAEAEDAEVRTIDRTDLALERPGATFDGRDRFAPAAAHLARGEPLSQLGAVLDHPQRFHFERPSRTRGSCKGRVAHVDRFGNLITDLPSHWLGEEAFRVTVGNHSTKRFARHYAELPSETPAVIPGSLGTLELSLNGASLATAWEIERGHLVEIEFGYNDRERI